MRQRSETQDRLRWLLHTLDPGVRIPLDALDRKVCLDRLGRRLARSAQIYISTSHASYFTANLAAILAELRAAHGVLFPIGVGRVTGWD